MLTVCPAQHEGTFQSAKSVRENTVCYNTAPLQDLLSPFPPTIEGGEQQVEPVLKNK